MTKVVSQAGLTKLIQLSKDEFLSKSDTVDASTVLSGYVPTSRTVNGKALTSNISLSASDVGALPDSTVIPTVNNATLTIQKNGTTVKTFTANASSNVTANITVPTKTSDLSNDSGFISGITSSDVTTALGYTPYNSTNPSGYQANVIETVKVNGTALTPSSKAVDITVPAAQVNSDWNASTGVAQILNKPSLATVATSGSYTDLSNKPTIPTVNNATLTITQGGTTKGTFTANASSNVTIDLDAGGGGSVDVDNKSITTNSSDQIQTVGVINSRDSSTAIKTWTGTKAQYDALKPVQSWYAWTTNSTVYYTTSATPSVGDTIYDSNKQDSGKTVSAVGTGTISWADPTITLSVIEEVPSDVYAWDFPQSVTINGNSVSENDTVTVNAGESCSIVVSHSSSGNVLYIFVNHTLVQTGYSSISYTFSPDSNSTIGVGYKVGKE